MNKIEGIQDKSDYEDYWDFSTLVDSPLAVVVPTANHPLSKPIQTQPLLRQIILYLIGYGNNNRSSCFLHCYNPAVGDYLFSSAPILFDGTDPWNMLSHLYE